MVNFELHEKWSELLYNVSRKYFDFSRNNKFYKKLIIFQLK